MSNDPEGDVFFESHVAADHCGTTTGNLAQLRFRGEGPIYYRAGRKILYKKSDLDAWLATLKPVRIVPDRKRTKRRNPKYAGRPAPSELGLS